MLGHQPPYLRRASSGLIIQSLPLMFPSLLYLVLTCGPHNLIKLPSVEGFVRFLLEWSDPSETHGMLG